MDNLIDAIKILDEKVSKNEQILTQVKIRMDKSITANDQSLTRELKTKYIQVIIKLS